MKLKEKLIELRKEKGLSQLKLAEMMNVSRQAISRWEVGSAVPSIDNLKYLGHLYGVPLEYLLYDDMPEPDRAVKRIEETTKHQKKRISMILIAIGVMVLKNSLYKKFILGFVLFLLLVILFAQQRNSAGQISYSLEDLERKGLEVASNVELISYPLLEDEGGTFVIYSQSPDTYGISNSTTWVIYKTSDENILVQDASLSRPLFIVSNNDSIYIFGETTAFASITGINITRYTIAENQLIIENAISEYSLGSDFYVYQDEINKDLFSVMPVAEDGMGRMYFDEIEDEARLKINVVDGSKEYPIIFELNDAGQYIMRNSEGTDLDPSPHCYAFSVSKNFDTLLKNASIFEKGCSPLRRTRKARTLAG